MFLVSMFLVAFASLVSAEFDPFAMRDDMYWNDVNICSSYKAEVISEAEFPKARAFLQKLINKYPEEFENVSFYMARNFSPFAGCGIIGISYEWLIQLEAEVPVSQKYAEWALLHEAGHIHHQHVKVFSYLNIGQGFFFQVIGAAAGMIFAMNFMGEEEFKKVNGQHYSTEYLKKMALFGVAGIISCLVSYMAYSKYVAEPQADDFAAERCQSKEALEAGAKWIDKVSVDNPMYPSVDDRVSKINKAIEKRFAAN